MGGFTTDNLLRLGEDKANAENSWEVPGCSVVEATASSGIVIDLPFCCKDRLRRAPSAGGVPGLLRENRPAIFWL